MTEDIGRFLVKVSPAKGMVRLVVIDESLTPVTELTVAATEARDLSVLLRSAADYATTGVRPPELDSVLDLEL